MAILLEDVAIERIMKLNAGIVGGRRPIAIATLTTATRSAIIVQIVKYLAMIAIEQRQEVF